MVRPVLVGAAVLGAWLVAAPAAQAQLIFTASLSGANERPTPNSSTATGTGAFTLNAAQTQLSYNIVYSGLSPSTLSGAHFHGPADVNTAAGVVFDLSPQGPGGHPSGSFVGVWNIDATNLSRLLNGLLYVNIHTNPTFGGGEIRGQVVPVPEPATFALTGLALTGAFAYGRRRRAVA